MMKISQEQIVYLMIKVGVPVTAQWLTNLTRSHVVAGLIPGLAQWVKGLVLQTQLGSCVAAAVVQAGGYSSDYTPSLGISICRGCSLGKDKKTGKKKKKLYRQAKPKRTQHHQTSFKTKAKKTFLSRKKKKATTRNKKIVNGIAHW